MRSQVNRALSSVVLVAALFVCHASVVSAAPSMKQVAGTYTATTEGNTVTLTLSADGTGALAGEPGRWSLNGLAITLTGSEGAVTGTVKGKTLTFTVDGATIQFRKSSGNATAGSEQAAASGKPFKPKLVGGKRLRPKQGNGSFRLPRGWKHAWGEGVDGNDALNLVNKKQTVAVSLGRTLLTGEDRSLGADSLIEGALAALLKGASVERAVETETFTVGGHPAGRTVVRASVDGVDVEGYLGAVVVNGWAFSVIGLYKVADAKEGRAAADTVLATLKVKAPKLNTTLMSKMAGCWLYSESSSGGFTSSKLQLNADGTYRRKFTVAVSNIDVGSGLDSSSFNDTSIDAGSWAVHGTTATFLPSGKKEKTRESTVRFKRSLLYLGSQRYGGC